MHLRNLVRMDFCEQHGSRHRSEELLKNVEAGFTDLTVACPSDSS